jgi:hypothetical protein
MYNAAGSGVPRYVPTPAQAAYNSRTAQLARIVSSNPNVMASHLAMTTGDAQSEAALRQLISGDVIAWGDPKLATDMGFAVDPETARIAAQNTASGFSQSALLNLAASHAADAMYTRLASLGGGNTGETGFETKLNNQANALDTFNKLSALQGDIQAGVVKNTNTQQNLANAYQSAVYRATPQGTIPPVGTSGSPSVAAPHNTSGATGLAPGAYQNTTGAGLPNYHLANMGSLSPGSYQNAAGSAMPHYVPAQTVSAAPAPSTGLAPGSYQNAAGAGAPNYVPTG